MSPTRENLHKMIDVVDNSEISFVFHMLSKLIPDNIPLPDEEECLRTAIASPSDYLPDEAVDWDNLSEYSE
ncbi:MAG: hypothetical protein LBM16_04865 [Clostridiales bacterium]|jgi:hypothetical protein|nr:hypothetical protein [Clostridiales bacterium]